ncbi:MAG: hypothetical protein WA996_00595 [Candidatus Promineifilaceae bacterium]
MEYGKIINRSVNIVWQNKFLILLGILVSLGSGSYGGSGGGGGKGNGAPLEDEIAAWAVGLIVALACVALIVVIVFWAISTIARGGLIASVDSIESGEKSSFRQSWSAGWHRAWTLLGIGILPAIPYLILLVFGLLALGAYGGIFALFGEDLDSLVGTAGLGITIAALACIVVPIVLVLSILRNFAERACMLENLGVIDSYRRGTSVLMANLGAAIILFLIQIAIFIVLGILLFVPGIIAAVCCFLWPLLLAVQGAISAFVSALWTLAWRTWTGEPPIVEKAPAAV